MNTEDHSNTSSILFFLPTFHNCFFSESCLDPWYIAAGVVILLSSILGILANISVTVKLIQNLRGSSMSQHLIFNLALSDLLCLLILVVGSIVFWTGLHLNHSICQLLVYLLFFCNTTNLNIPVLISIQRYYQVRIYHSFKYVVIFLKIRSQVGLLFESIKSVSYLGK